ncbi:hypothetical protein E2C01_066057 [Portunus trituberculatus]|uniref:Uncharacterized protein n=1 Tax=Portunus trituberculatus TaxID=210409 RepID=A0A5B7HG66_PORTR|nr:hypothetical protein [Portunus trituberculatus]
MAEGDSLCVLIGLEGGLTSLESCKICCTAARGLPSLNSNRQVSTQWSVATLPPKLSFIKLRFAKYVQ